MGEPRTKGSKIRAKLIYVTERYGAAKAAEVVAALAEADREALRIVLDGSWYPFSLYERTLAAVCRVAGGGDDAIYTAIGEHSAEHQLKTAYKVFRGDRDPLAAIRKSVPLHAKLNDPGEMELTETGPNACVLRVRTPRPSLAGVCAVARAFYRRSIELTGSRGVRVDHPRCAALGHRACDFVISWVSD